MNKAVGSGFAGRILFSPLRWWFVCGIVGVLLFVLLLGLVADSRSQLRLYPGLVLQREMEKSLRGKRIDQIIPSAMANGEIVWFVRDTESRPFHSDRLIILNERDNEDLWIITREMGLYGVRMSSSTAELRVNGTPVEEVTGFIASPGPDGLVDYRPDERKLAVYDPTNGSTSSGDIVYLFRQ